jgi:hypothetical protein
MIQSVDWLCAAVRRRVMCWCINIVNLRQQYNNSQFVIRLRMIQTAALSVLTLLVVIHLREVNNCLRRLRAACLLCPRLARARSVHGANAETARKVVKIYHSVLRPCGYG